MQESTLDLNNHDVSNNSSPLHSRHCPVHTVVEDPFCQLTENAKEEPGLLYGKAPICRNGAVCGYIT